jgi:hypothetical protein
MAPRNCGYWNIPNVWHSAHVTSFPPGRDAQLGEVFWKAHYRVERGRCIPRGAAALEDLGQGF